MSALRLGSRGSQLALFQANLVAERLLAAGGPRCDVIIIKTAGDRVQDKPLSEIGGKRLFVKEIEDALLNDEIDLAVHSSKDMPAVLPDGLAIGAVLERADPRDAFVLPSPPTQVADRPRIGTGSVRRIAQLRARFPDATFLDVRGNLDTRLRKLDAGQYDMLVLAAAGLIRLGLGHRMSASISLEECVPAPGQGIIAVETRAGDTTARAALASINDAVAADALAAERALVTALGGGCQMPIGGIAVPAGPSDLELRAIVSSLDGSRVIRYKQIGPRAGAAALGQEVADQLLRLGAADVLKEARTANQEPRQLT